MRCSSPLLRRPLLLLVFLLLGGCASTGGGGLNAGAYTTSLGTATLNALNEELSGIFTRFGYTVQRSELQGENLYLETQWRTRTPLEAEQALGAREARTRLIITTRPRPVTNRNLQPLHAFTLRSEHEYATDLSGTWRRLEVTDETRRYVDEIADALRKELTVKSMN